MLNNTRKLQHRHSKVMHGLKVQSTVKFAFISRVKQIYMQRMRKENKDSNKGNLAAELPFATELMKMWFIHRHPFTGYAP